MVVIVVAVIGVIVMVVLLELLVLIVILKRIIIDELVVVVIIIELALVVLQEAHIVLLIVTEVVVEVRKIAAHVTVNFCQQSNVRSISQAASAKSVLTVKHLKVWYLCNLWAEIGLLLIHSRNQPTR